MDIQTRGNVSFLSHSWSNHQLSCRHPAPSRSADQTITKAAEFTSEEFETFLQKHEVKGITTSPHAHWQNGRCERRGQILQTLLDKLDHESAITSFKDFQQALVQCTHAQNTLSIRSGFAPEVLVFGKSSKLPGSVTSSEDISAHASANREDAQGIAFRQSLAFRERARVAFHRADNDMALRRACLQRTRPDRQGYQIGEWVMMWQPQENASGYWFGPLKVIQQEKNLSVWATAAGTLHRRAPEHVRPVWSSEARSLPEEENTSIGPAQNVRIPDLEIPSVVPPENPAHHPHDPKNSNLSKKCSSQAQEQPDQEPEENSSNAENPNNMDDNNLHINTPVPENDSDDQLVTSHLLCCDDEVFALDPLEEHRTWRFEMEVPRNLHAEAMSGLSLDEVLVATSEKKQRTEVKLSLLSPQKGVLPEGPRNRSSKLADHWYCIKNLEKQVGPWTNPAV